MFYHIMVPDAVHIPIHLSVIDDNFRSFKAKVSLISLNEYLVRVDVPSLSQYFSVGEDS